MQYTISYCCPLWPLVNLCCVLQRAAKEAFLLYVLTCMCFLAMQPVKAFALPAVAAAGSGGGGGGGGGPTAAHTVAAEELRAAAAGAVEAEGWRRVMVWGSGGAFLGVAGDGAVASE